MLQISQRFTFSRYDARGVFRLVQFNVNNLILFYSILNYNF